MRHPQINKLIGATIVVASFPVWVLTGRQSWLMVAAGLIMVALGSIQAAETSGGDRR